jgi:hypothetical protein
MDWAWQSSADKGAASATLAARTRRNRSAATDAAGRKAWPSRVLVGFIALSLPSNRYNRMTGCMFRRRR